MELRKQGKNILWDPVDGIESLRNEINTLFDFQMYPAFRGLFDRAVSPTVDVMEDTNSVVVECDLPGVNKDDIDVSVAGRVLTIRGEKKRENETKDRKVYKIETWKGSFQRTIALPSSVDTASIKATLKEGVLRISLSKRESAKKIAVNSE
jgi:HSP20 family protein